jgi:hypothetical protein
MGFWSTIAQQRQPSITWSALPRKEGSIHLMGRQVDLRVSKHRDESFYIGGGAAFGQLISPIFGVVISYFHSCTALADKRNWTPMMTREKASWLLVML